MKSGPALERAYALIEQAAIKGDRCPQGQPFGQLTSDAVMTLARDGRIRVEIFMHNWRVVTILTGPNVGKQTAPPPKPKGQQRSTPYKVSDASGTRINGRVQEPYETRSKRIGPSAPRDFSAHGLRDLKERGR